jgi:hypothetical protein
MKINYTHIILIFLMLCLGVQSCRKSEDLTEQVNRMNFIPEQDKISNEIDQWIYDTFTVPYNIRIEYR